MTDQSDPPDDAAPWRDKPITIVILCAAAGWALAGIAKVDPLLSANDRSRWCTVWSLVEQGTYRIDDITKVDGWDTIDKVRVTVETESESGSDEVSETEPEHHFYSSKPPLFSTMVAGVYYVVKAATGWNLTDDTAAVTRLVLIFVNLIPWLIALWVLARMTSRYATSNATKVLVPAAAAFGTFLTTYTVTLNNHLPAAICVVFTLSATMRILVDGRRRAAYYVVVGLFAAFACTFELPAALFGVGVFGVLAFHDVGRTAKFFVPAALVPLVAFFWTNYQVTGGVKPFYAYYGTEIYEYTHEGVPSYWMHPAGIDANQEPPSTYLFHCTLGHHGILSLTPVFLITLCGWLAVPNWKAHRLRIALAMGLALTVAVLGFYLTRTQNYNYGGNTAGLRWSFWLIPFWLLGLIPLCDSLGHRRWFQVATGVLLLVSVFSANSAIENPWRPSWLYTWMQDRGWIDYSTPPPQFPRPLTTWFSKLPPWIPDNPAWMEFAGPNHKGELETLRIEDHGPKEVDGKSVRELLILRNKDAANASQYTFFVDEDLFNQGVAPEEFLCWTCGEGEPPSAEARHTLVTLLRNMPRDRPYNAGRIRYLKTPFAPDAFTCQIAASRVPYQPAGGSQKYWYRSETWICEQMPFGVIRFETILNDAESNAPAGYQKYELVGLSWYQ